MSMELCWTKIGVSWHCVKKKKNISQRMKSHRIALLLAFMRLNVLPTCLLLDTLSPRISIWEFLSAFTAHHSDCRFTLTFKRNTFSFPCSDEATCTFSKGVDISCLHVSTDCQAQCQIPFDFIIHSFTMIGNGCPILRREEWNKSDLLTTIFRKHYSLFQFPGHILENIGNKNWKVLFWFSKCGKVSEWR